jgi:hypothetical protein
MTILFSLQFLQEFSSYFFPYFMRRLPLVLLNISSQYGQCFPHAFVLFFKRTQQYRQRFLTPSSFSMFVIVVPTVNSVVDGGEGGSWS